MDISICIFDYTFYTFSNNKNHNFRSSKTQQSDILRFWKSNNSKFWYFAQKHISILPQVLNRGSTSRSPVHTHSTTGPRWFTNTSLQKVTCFRFGERDRDYVKVKPSRADQDQDGGWRPWHPIRLATHQRPVLLPKHLPRLPSTNTRPYRTFISATYDNAAHFRCCSTWRRLGDFGY